MADFFYSSNRQTGDLAVLAMRAPPESKGFVVFKYGDGSFNAWCTEDIGGTILLLDGVLCQLKEKEAEIAATQPTNG